ncbi:hypothetical protein BFP72_08535 [Reichenbachiella sp. 5M10]|uniref:DUF4302 domain-containing protein n=1 Tax=Reichenbachiella sp. 5M10 TaxID=1889772 RepID=UPI000C1568AA|nr:DUF4302 domain-containing protein [Reichenbachiella sp. 5M10]PIB35438.1 hypothetical protein BFP72_08535 [Reichenbachiella sp. 5M10]
MKKLAYISIWLLLLWGCGSDDGGKLDSADVRRQSAIDELRDKLMAPEHGWMLQYQPVPGSGAYYILLDFDEEEVRIQSDLASEEGTLYDQTIPYRVDVQLAVQLTFETYAVFHYLFEQDQSTFGAEFEFFYLEEDGENLILYSKTDAVNKTSIVLVPAPANAEQGFSREEAANLDMFELYSQPLGTQTMQQLYLMGDDLSVYWSIDLTKRVLTVDGAAPGLDSRAITSWVAINQEHSFTLFGGSMVLEEPITFGHGGKEYSIQEVELNTLNHTGEVYCSAEIQDAPVYTGSVAGLGAVELRHTLFESSGLDFVTQSDVPYSINIFYVADSTGFSMTDDDQIIGQLYPDASGFIFNYGRDSMEIDYSVGISYLDENDVRQTHLRGFESVAVLGNYLEVVLNEEFSYTNADEVTAEDEQNLRDVTDEIFGTGQLYISNWPIVEDLVVFRLYNPCNGNEFALVQP